MKYLKKVYECAMGSCGYIEGYEIDEIKMLVEYDRLPKSYIEFLNTMGKRVDFFDGELYQIDKLEIIKKGANRILIEQNIPFSLEDNDFVFWTSQGCLYAFFKLGEGEDPPVYAFFPYRSPVEKPYIKVSASFSNFLLKMCHHDKTTFNEVED